MGESTGDRAAVYFVRAWMEGGAFRARVIWSTDVEYGEERSTTTTDPDAIRRLLDRWLIDLTSPA